MMRNECLVAACLLVGGAGTAPAQDVEAGMEGSVAARFAWLSVSGSVPLGDHHAVTLGATASYFWWRFPDDPAPTWVRAPGINPTLGYEFGTDRVSLWAAVGIVLRWSRETPPVGTVMRTLERGPTLEGELTWYVVPRLAVTTSAYYERTEEYSWVRFRINREPTARGLAIGLEGVTHGNEYVRAHQAGVLLTLIGASTSFELRFGLDRSRYYDEINESLPYFGATLTRSF